MIQHARSGALPHAQPAISVTRLAAAGTQSMPVAPVPAAIVRVRPTQEVTSAQGLPNLPGISCATGATGLSMKLVVVPPGGAAVPHIHQGFETAIYCLSGRIETRYGPGLRQAIVSEPGDFLFIPAGVPHQPINLSATQPARAIVARNDPAEHESVVLYDPTVE